MKYYGKSLNEFTKEETNLFNMDMITISSMEMNQRGETLIGMGFELGTDDDVQERLIDRCVYAGELLGIPVPTSDKEGKDYFEKVEKSRYSFNDIYEQYRKIEYQLMLHQDQFVQ